MHQDKKMKKAVIIIPTYNEAGNLPTTLEKIAQVFKTIKDWQMQVLVVDDSSPDGTAEVVKKLQKQYSFLKLLLNKRKSGLGGAYLKGMAEAFNELGADLVFEFDADLSHDPKKIPAMLSKIDQGADFVLGSRYIKGGSIPADWGLHRKFLSVVGNAFIKFIMFDFSIHDWTTGYRAIKKEVYEAVSTEMNSERFSGYTFQIGFLHKTLRRGFKIAEVPFDFKDRTIGKSKIGPEYIKNTLLFLMKVRIQEILKMRLFKFVVVGSLGAATQLISLQLWRLILPFQLAFFTAIETAVIANFILSNLWTFADRKLKAKEIPGSFLKFNLSSGGSILIQQILAIVGEQTIGIKNILTIPVINYPFDTGTLFAIVGILVGMFWNYFAYNTFVWKKKKK